MDKILWSIALPGFGQLLNRSYFKGFILIILEFLINVNANLNEVIIASFHGDMQKAIELTNYQWLMFYPCIYLFAIWDAFRDAGGDNSGYSVIPFVGSAYLGTIGVIYSKTFQFMGNFMGPIFLPIAYMILGFALGVLLKNFLSSTKRRNP